MITESKLLWSGKRLAVVGGGNMAEALVRGILAGGLIPAPNITVFDILPARRDVFAALGCATAETPQDALDAADAVLLAVKPQKTEEALRGLAFRDQLLVSIVAGIPSSRLAALTGNAPRIVRVMPNTPLLVGMGAAGVARGSGATDVDAAMTMAIFSGSGFAAEVSEDRLDAVTALSGSGPAYLFRFAEALAESGAALGLPAELAAELTSAMLRGAAEMLSRFGDPAQLRKNVTSPGGTTATALAVFEERGFAALVADALTAARDRSVELGRGK